MDVIREYERDSIERRKLEAAAKVLNAYTDARITVKETYFDYGQDWKWTTLIADCGGWSTFQLLYPKQQENLIFADPDEFYRWIQEVIEMVNKHIDRAKGVRR